MSENLYTPYIPVRYFEKSISPENDRKTLFLGCIDMKPCLEISKILEIRKLTDFLSQKKYNLSIYVSIFLSIYLYLSIYNWASCFRKQKSSIYPIETVWKRDKSLIKKSQSSLFVLCLTNREVFPNPINEINSPMMMLRPRLLALIGSCHLDTWINEIESNSVHDYPHNTAARG